MDGEGQPAAEVPERPAARGQRVTLVRAGELGQERVNDDDGRAVGRVREQEQDEPELPVRAGQEASAAVAPAPMKAKVPSMRRLFRVRSAMAPVIGSTSNWITVASEIR